MSASVRVMNSHDYSHFEVVLSTDAEVTPQDVNEMRKTAQRLVDNAIRQYKVAKEKANERMASRYERELMIARAKVIAEIPENERTEEQKAVLKVLDDEAWEAQFAYDYDDDDELF